MPTTTVSEPAPKKGAGRDLPAAIGVGVGLLTAIAVGLIWAHWFFVGLVALALSLGAVEVHRALQRKGMHASIVPVVVGTVVIVIGGWLVSRFELGISPGIFAVLVLGGTAIASFTARLRKGPEGFLRDVAASSFLIAYIPLLGVCLAFLMGETNGPLRFLTLILCAVASDTGAYVVGSLLGKHKMAPLISPSKTWEGLFGAVVVTTIVAVSCVVWLLDAPWWLGLLLGIPVSLAATLGDLVESLIKRDAGLKDMSNFLPGHGGVMDRLDSMLVAVPVGWFILHIALGA